MGKNHSTPGKVAGKVFAFVLMCGAIGFAIYCIVVPANYTGPAPLGPATILEGNQPADVIFGSRP